MYSLRPRHLLPPWPPNDTGSGTDVLLRGGSGTFELPLGGSSTFVPLSSVVVLMYYSLGGANTYVLLLRGSDTHVLLPHGET